MLTVHEVAERVGLTQWAIYRAIHRGELTAYKPGGRLRVHEDDFEHWLQTTRVHPPAASAEPPARVTPVTPLGLPTRRRAQEDTLRARVKAARRGQGAA